MKLKYLMTTRCPVCGTDVIIEERIEGDPYRLQIRTHVNGEQWEHRKFICGQEIEYIPNYHADELSKINVCTNNEEYKVKIGKQKEANVRLVQVIDTLEVDAGYKERLKKQFMWV